MVEGDAIADREEAGNTGLHEVVDQNAVVDGRAGGFSQCDIGRDADADDGDVGRDAVAGSGFDRHHLAALPDDAADRGAKAHVAAPAAMQRQEVVRDLRRDDAAHQPVGGFQHRHRLAGEARGAGDLQPDEAAADDHDVVGGMERGAQAARILGMAQREDAVEIDAIDRRQARRGAGGKRQPVEGNARAVREHHRRAGPVDSTRPSAPRRRSMAFFS